MRMTGNKTSKGYLPISVAEWQGFPWHLVKVLLPCFLVSVGAHKDNLKVVSIWSLLDLFVPLTQVWSEGSATQRNDNEWSRKCYLFGINYYWNVIYITTKSIMLGGVCLIFSQLKLFLQGAAILHLNHACYKSSW